MARVLSSGETVELRPKGVTTSVQNSCSKDAQVAALAVAGVARPSRPSSRVAAVSPLDSVAIASGSGTSVEHAQNDEESCASSASLVRSPSGERLVNQSARFPFGVTFTFWLYRRQSSVGGEKAADSEALEALGSFNEVHDFWRYWNSIRLDSLPEASSLSVFLNPERPRAGKKAPGGRWIIDCGGQGQFQVDVSPSSGCATNAKARAVFKHLVLALIGGVFDEASEASPCGVVLTADAMVEVWNRCAEPSVAASTLQELRALVGLEVEIDYVAHAIPKASAALTPMNTPSTSRQSPPGNGSGGGKAKKSK